jgi:transposase
MPPQLSPPERLKKLFRRRPCWMLDQLAQALDYALISIRRFLKEIGYFRSYTDNGKWYTLHDSPHFDRDGLWHFKGIGFSKHGSLTATIQHLLARSPAGLSAAELSAKLQHPCHAVLTQLHKAGHLDRLPLAGQFRYFATDPQLNRRQREQAAAAQGTAADAAMSTQTALWVLVEHIKNPGLSFEQLAALLQAQRHVAVAPEHIQRLFQEQGLKKAPGAFS